MKKIINNRRYDTSTAEAIGYASYSNRMDFGFWEETLYRKRNGEFFIHGEGGPASRYAVRVELNSWKGGEQLIPLDYEAAREWAESNMKPEEYEKAFGPVEEGCEGDKLQMSFSLPEKTKEQIRRGAAAEGVSMSEYIARLVERDQK